MRIWGKRKEKRLTQTQEAVAVRIAERLIRLQKNAADYLNKKTAGISAKGWLILLICFIAGFGSYCLMLFLEAFK